MDFLPNSIVRSPQRAGTSHTMTTQRLGLTKVNRIGAFMKPQSEPARTQKGSSNKKTFAFPVTPQSKMMEFAHTTQDSCRSSSKQPTTAASQIGRPK